MDGEVSPASNRGSTDPPPYSEMAEGRRTRGWRVVRDGKGDSARFGDFAAACECIPALRFRSLGPALADAASFLQDWRERLRKFGLELHPDKTRLIEFGRFAAENRKRRGEGKPETFNFLGFTHICGRSRKNGKFLVLRKTIRKRLLAKLKQVKVALWRRMHQPLAEVGKWLRSVVQGYFNYHAVPGNSSSLWTFRLEVCKRWLRVIRRRSQKSRVTWKHMAGFAKQWLPMPKILHPYPGGRFDAKHLRYEPRAVTLHARSRAGGAGQPASLPQPIHRIPRAMTIYQFLLGMVLAIYVGFSRLNHLRFIAQDPMLTGVLQVEGLPPQCTFWRFLTSIPLTVAQQLLKLQRLLRERVWEAAHVQLSSITLDTDTTVHTLYGRQMGARKSYNPKNKGKKSEIVPGLVESGGSRLSARYATC